LRVRVILIAVGRLKAGPERVLFERYQQRLVGMARSVGVSGFDFREVDEGRARHLEERREEEARAIQAIAPGGAALILCDERGKALSSLDFAAELGGARDRAASAFVLVIGGPDGFDPAFRSKASRLVAFGAMTWPHQLVRIMAAEQLYRALTILAGHPYHRS
jgi:23S rRNA (pseudouridine1915-N3)-methyltransferase